MNVIVFDVFGTLFDVESLLGVASRFTSNPRAFTEDWRRKQLEYSFLLSLMDRFESFWTITKKALNYATEKHQLSFSESQREELMSAWLKLEAYPDTRECLERLRPLRTLVVLSNGDKQFLDQLLENSRLKPYFREVISAEQAKAYKPSPRVYQLAAEILKTSIKDLMMVSSNSFDVIGSKAAGMRACWIRRRSEPLDPLGWQPDLLLKSLAELPSSIQ